MPEKTGMNELARRACKDNIISYSLQFDKLCYCILLATVHKDSCFFSDNTLSLWQDITHTSTVSRLF